MTMSVQHNSISEMTQSQILRTENNMNENSVTSLPSKSSMKRSFDVAFLISQDDKNKQKQIRVNKYDTLSSNSETRKFTDVEDDIESRNSSPEIRHVSHLKFSQDPPSPRFDVARNHASINSQSRLISNNQSPPKVFDDPTILVTRSNSTSNYHEQKSAFTKVNFNQKMDNRVVSPNLSISPDLSYQNSLSPSPPIINSYVQKSFQNLIPSTNNHMFKNSLSPYQNAFIEQNFVAATTESQQLYHSKSLLDHQNLIFKNHHNDANLFVPKLRPNMLNFRPELPSYAYPVGGFSTIQSQQDMMKFPSPSHQDIVKLQVNPAAILNTLLPPSLAALSLPSQNVCAKCNISFRMTSDLVYHMRSHHKNDVANEALKKRREDKLKCPVCSESFRERHHLTRHMTAHQDKEGDVLDEQSNCETTSNSTSHSNSGKRKSLNANFNNIYCK